MKRLIFSILFLLATALPSSAEEAADDSRTQALNEFDDNVNGSTALVDNLPKVDREAMIQQHREDEAAAMDDELDEIDGAMWYGYAKKKGWLDED